MKCPKCENINDADARFCDMCGTPLVGMSSSRQPEAPRPAAVYEPAPSETPDGVNPALLATVIVAVVVFFVLCACPYLAAVFSSVRY